MEFRIKCANFKTGCLLVSGRYYVRAFSLIFVLLISCAYHGEVKVKPPSGGELLKENKAIFLFRLSIEIDGKMLDMYQEYNKNRIQISISNIDTESSIEHLATVYSPSSEMSKNGWFYILLDPAAYYMKIALLWQPKINPILFSSQTTQTCLWGIIFILL